MANQIPAAPVLDLPPRPVGELDDHHEIEMGGTDQIGTGEVEGGKGGVADCGCGGSLRRVEQTLGRIERAMVRDTLMHLPST